VRYSSSDYFVSQISLRGRTSIVLSHSVVIWKFTIVLASQPFPPLPVSCLYRFLRCLQRTINDRSRKALNHRTVLRPLAQWRRQRSKGDRSFRGRKILHLGHPDALFLSKKLTTSFSCRPQNKGRQRRFTVKVKK